jgi:hypothetical protein
MEEIDLSGKLHRFRSFAVEWHWVFDFVLVRRGERKSRRQTPRRWGWGTPLKKRSATQTCRQNTRATIAVNAAD